MFTRSLSLTPFYDDASNLYFEDRIKEGLTYNGDRSLISTARALLHPRMPADAMLTVQSFRSRLSDIALTIAGCCDANQSNSLMYFRVMNPAEGWFKDLTDCLGDRKFEEITKVRDFFAAGAPETHCLVDKERKNSFIITAGDGMSFFHYSQITLLGWFPWYDKKTKLTDDEMALVKSLKLTSEGTYRDALEKIADSYGFRADYEYNALKQFESKRLVEKKAALKSELTSIEDSINRMFAEVSSLLGRKEDVNIEIDGLSHAIRAKETRTELADCFRDDPDIEFDRMEDEYIIFRVKAPLATWQEDYIADSIEDYDSFVYYHEEAGSYLDLGDMTEDEVHDLMKAVFVDRTVGLNLCGTFKLSTSYAYSVDHDDYPSKTFDGCMPNPHHWYHGCIGSYRPAIVKYMAECRYIPAIAQCKASVGNINFSDGTVREELMNNIWGYQSDLNLKAFVLPDGEVTDRAGVLEFLSKGE